MSFLFAPLLAVHISDGILYWPVSLAGFLLLAGFLCIGLRSLAAESWKSSEGPISLTALLTAAFFVATLIHVKLGPTSVHLLLNGLVGLLLGRRACLAIPIGVALQAILLGHGGLSTIGINSCTMLLPALLARPLYRFCHDSYLAGWKEFGLAVTCLLFPAALVFVVPATLLLRVSASFVRLSINFICGFIVGGSTVLLTSALTALVVARGGEEDWTNVAILLLAAHLPLALIEGMIVGFACSFLAKVRPDLLPGDCEDWPGIARGFGATSSTICRDAGHEEGSRISAAGNRDFVIPMEKSPPAGLPTDLSPH
jgi:cobalt/nickel transport system permease protein